MEKDKIELPIKVGNEDGVKTYSSSLTNGEEQLLITRDSKKVFLTDGKGNSNLISSGDNEDLKKEIGEEKLLTKATDIKSAINEVFQCANSKLKDIENKKMLIVGAIGDKDLAKKSFEEMSNEIIQIKERLANAITDKGVNCSKDDSLETMAYKTDLIIHSPKIINTKLNVTAPFKKTVKLKKKTDLEHFCTTIVEYEKGDGGIVQYDCNFDNSDNTNFANIGNITYDGTMKQENKKVEFKNTPLADLDGLKQFEYDIDLSEFYQVNDISVDNDNLIVNGTYKPSLVCASSDINLINVERISKIEWNGKMDNDSKLYIIFSLDSGKTWNGYDVKSKSITNIDINNIEDIKSKTFVASDFNSFTITDLENIRKDSPKIRFGYLFDKMNYNDSLYNDELKIMVEMKGKSKPSKEVDYEISEDGLEVTYTFNKSNTYTLMYVQEENPIVKPPISKSLINNLVSNCCDYGEVISDSPIHSGDIKYDYYLAFDKEKSKKNDHYFFCPEVFNGSNYNVGFKFDDKKVVDKYSLCTFKIYGDNWNTAFPKDWAFEGSNDGKNWNVLDTQKDISDWKDGISKEFKVVKPNKYKMYRINVTANNGDKWNNVSGFQMYGYQV